MLQILLRLARLALAAVDGHRQVVDRPLRGHQVGMVRVRAARVLQQRLKCQNREKYLSTIRF